MNAYSIKDGLSNIVANLGTSRDKAYSSHYTHNLLSDSQLISAYRGAWLPRKIVDIPAFDACREWRSWNASKEQIESLEKTEKLLGVKSKVMRALKNARLLGGCAIFIGTGETNLEVPLDPERIGKDGLKYLTIIPKGRLSAGNEDRDPSSEWFGKPSMWTMQSGNLANLNVHPSRLVIFVGSEIPDDGMIQDIGWGDSTLSSVYEAVTQADSTTANIASLIFEAKIDVVQIPNLTSSLSDKAYEATLIKRFQIAATGKGINGMLILDKEEEYSQKNASFASLADLMDRFYKNVSGAADIPMTRLFGQSPGGLNATGDSDLINYYDRVSSMQELELSPAMMRLDECLVRSSLGSRPEEIHYTWSPLWQESEKGKAEIGKIIADTTKVLSDAGLYAPEALAEATTNSLTEVGCLPGLEEAVETYGPPDEPDPEEEKEALVPKKDDSLKKRLGDAGLLADATPRTLYVHRKVKNANEILKWAKSQGFKSTLRADDLHVTVIYSKTPIDWMKVSQSWESEMTLPEGGPRLMERLGEANVLLFGCRDLIYRHSAIKQAGASSDYDEYQPHITISYEDPDLDLSKIEPYQGKIVLGPEIFAEVKENWRPKETITDNLERVLKAFPSPTFNIDVRPSENKNEPPIITVNTPAVNVAPPNVVVNIPDAQPIPVNVTVMPAHVQAGDVHVHMPEPGEEETEVIEHDDKGRIKKTRKRPVK